MKTSVVTFDMKLYGAVHRAQGRTVGGAMGTLTPPTLRKRSALLDKKVHF